MSSSTFAKIFAQATDAATSGAAAATDPAQQAQPVWLPFLYMIAIGGAVYFMLIRPQTVAKNKQEETIKSAKTGDKVVTTGGIVGIITNVKDTTVILRSADTKFEIEKSHIDKITRESADTEKAVAKAS